MHELVEQFEALKEQVALSEIYMAKFVNGAKGAKAAGVRVRKSMLEIKTRAHEIRNLISKIKNEGTYKTEEK